MNAKKARAARRAAPPVHSSRQQQSWWLTWKGGAVGLAVVGLLAASFVLPGLLSSDNSGTQHEGMAMGGLGVGEGLPVGSPVPTFSEKDVQTGVPISSESLAKGKTLLFFSEGVMCQACFQQIKGLEEVGAQLRQRGIRLVSITPDPKNDLLQAIAQFDIRTPMIADSNRDMSSAFNTLGKGMHGDTPGHSFVLMQSGTVLWYRDYWLPPTRSMFVKAKQLLADLPA